MGSALRSRETPSHVWYLWKNWNRQVSIEASATSSRFAVIGAGRLGSSLALALCNRGLTLVGFTAGSSEGRVRAERWLGSPATLRLGTLVGLRPDVYFICVPDGVVADVATELGAALGAGRGADQRDEADSGAAREAAAPRPVVAHTSGATSVSVLAPCEEAGAATLVFHPLQTFPDLSAGASRFAGAGAAITPGPAHPDEAGTTGLRIADLLGMRPFLLADDKRSLYHAAAAVACNYLVTLEHVANKLFVEAGVPERVTFDLFLPLVRAALDNLAARGPVDALTGPLSRGDEKTIAAHLTALSADAPDTLPLYRALGLQTLELVTARGEVDYRTIVRMRELLTGPTRPAAPAALTPITLPPPGDA
jgi:predicted short-subunit dehydrogenase-like oxidoreductase (DUF2520 family)